MSRLEPGKVYGEWIFEQEIGSGGFGLVTSWKRQKTHEMLVIKQCRTELDERNRARWMEEIHLMNTNTHKNLVSGLPIPEDIEKALSGPKPLLGLEYCDGDLRKLLSYPIHCCGLKEKAVLDILHDVSSGLEFLHKRKIVHRDLKPENILLSNKGTDVIYKITDLGYAKQMDAKSLCMSFVGTIQYLAPELYEQTGYTATADYWSFGTVIFECITGQRPFVLTDKPMYWNRFIKSKSDNEIWWTPAESNETPKFHSDIPQPNHICGAYLEAFKNWLQLVLCYDPQRRGNVPTKDGTFECFAQINHILEIKIIHVLNVLSCADIAYLCKPNDTGLELKEFLREHTNIPVESQLVVFNCGTALKDTDLLADAMTSLRKVDDILFLFSTNKRADVSVSPMPARVRELVGSPEEERSFVELKQSWGQALYYCNNTATEYSRLQQAERALILNTMRTKDSPSEQLKEDLLKAVVRLETAVFLFIESHDCDIEYCKASDFECLQEQLCTEDWDKMLKEVKLFISSTDVSDVLKALKNARERLQRYKDESRRSTEEEANTGLDKCSQQSLDLLAKDAEERYEKLRRRIHSKDQSKNNKHDSKHMSAIVVQCLEKQEKLFREYHRRIQKLTEIRWEISTIMERLESRKQKYEEQLNMTISHQRYRQGTLWRLFSSKNSSIASSDCSSMNKFVPSLNDLLDSFELVPEKSNETTEVITKLEDQWTKLGDLVIDEVAVDTSTSIENEILPPSPILSPVKSPLIRWSTVDGSPLVKSQLPVSVELSRSPRRSSETSVSYLLRPSKAPIEKLPAFTEIETQRSLLRPLISPNISPPYKHQHFNGPQSLGVRDQSGVQPSSPLSQPPMSLDDHLFTVNGERNINETSRPLEILKGLVTVNHTKYPDLIPNSNLHAQPYNGFVNNRFTGMHVGSRTQPHNVLGNGGRTVTESHILKANHEPKQHQHRIHDFEGERSSKNISNAHRISDVSREPSKPAVLRLYENLTPGTHHHLSRHSPRLDVNQGDTSGWDINCDKASPRWEDNINERLSARVSPRPSSAVGSLKPTMSSSTTKPEAYYFDPTVRDSAQLFNNPHVNESSYHIRAPVTTFQENRPIINDILTRTASPAHFTRDRLHGRPHLATTEFGNRQPSRQLTVHPQQYDRFMMPTSQQYSPTTQQSGFKHR